jgi:teichuronic acid biosynthesis glycosyltransferase TuaG
MGHVPLVSVVIPSFNSESYIRQTVESVRRQSLDDWELIVVDDCSTNGAPSVVDDLAQQDRRIRQIRLERNAGRPAIPRNVGLQAARGRYVAFLDADDLWHPQKLEVQIGFMRQRGARFTCTETRWFREEAEVADRLDARVGPPRATDIDHRRLLRKNVIPTSSVVAEREILARHPFIEDARYKAIEDYHCWLTVHQHEIDRSYKLSYPFVFYRLADSSISRSKLAMLRKNYMLYSEYRVGGERLGLRKYFYLGTYAWFSLADRASRSLA